MPTDYKRNNWHRGNIASGRYGTEQKLNRKCVKKI